MCFNYGHHFLLKERETGRGEQHQRVSRLQRRRNPIVHQEGKQNPRPNATGPQGERHLQVPGSRLFQAPLPDPPDTPHTHGFQPHHRVHTRSGQVLCNFSLFFLPMADLELNSVFKSIRKYKRLVYYSRLFLDIFRQ